jgi:tRNA threonylcarbamoyladenosine biosynthesis protein TsaB
VTTLAIDTTAKEVAVAVLRDGSVLAEARASAARSGSEVLMPLAEATMRAAGVDAPSLDLLAVAVGPGSFTGVRVGVALAKGLGFGQRMLAAPVSTTEALAENLLPLSGLYCPVMDARRSEVYHALFRAEGGRLVRLTPDRAISPEALARELCEDYVGETVLLVGDGVYVAEPILSSRGVSLGAVPPSLALHSAVSVARVGERMLRKGLAVSPDLLSPTYLREAQADEAKRNG